MHHPSVLLDCCQNSQCSMAFVFLESTNTEDTGHHEGIFDEWIIFYPWTLVKALIENTTRIITNNVYFMIIRPILFWLSHEL